MNLWLAASFSVVLALTGVGLGLQFSRMRNPYWMLGYFVPLDMIVIYAINVRCPSWALPPPLD